MRDAHHTSTSPMRPTITSPFQMSAHEFTRQMESSIDHSVGTAEGSPQWSRCSYAEYKTSTPPQNGSLIEFLPDRRIDRARIQSNRSFGHNQSDERSPRGCGDVASDDDEDSPRTLRVRSLRPRTMKQVDGEGVASLSSQLNSLSTEKTSSEAMDESSSTTSQGAIQGVKRSRYLREADRRDIIRRIDNGEKQAALAKEFGVTRAAICHINKNRVEILTRSARVDVHSGARHPKRGMYTTSKSSMFHSTGIIDGKGEAPIVYEVRSQPLAIHLTSLRRKETPHRTYRAIADRSFRVLLEEALAFVPTRSVDIITPSDAFCRGIVAEQPTCGIFIGECGYPMLEAFRCIQPDSPTGFMTLESDDRRTTGNTKQPPRISMRRLCAPPNLRGHNIFILDATCATGREAAVAIQSLIDFGAHETTIYFVTLIISAAAVTEISQRFPSVHIVAAAIDADLAKDGTIRPGIGNFQERYFNTTTIQQNDLGSNVEL